METPKPTLGLRHVALFVHKLEACEYFYSKLLGMGIDWRPDSDNVYLSTGYDNLALHRVKESFQLTSPQRLDHIGFVMSEIDEVDQWYQFLLSNQVEMKTEPRTHRDGARSFYCYDPDHNTVQMIWLPGLKK
ncbi:MAG: VOC family protein [Gammaproteobacteria bacterium]